MPPAPSGERISNGPSLVPDAKGIAAGIIALEMLGLEDFLDGSGARLRRVEATPGFFVSAHSKGVILVNLASAHSKGLINLAECALTRSRGGDCGERWRGGAIFPQARLAVDGNKQRGENCCEAPEVGAKCGSARSRQGVAVTVHGSVGDVGRREGRSPDLGGY
jgi:hypothetical protein